MPTSRPCEVGQGSEWPGSPAVHHHQMARTRGFAPPPLDGFALIGECMQLSREGVFDLKFGETTHI